MLVTEDPQPAYNSIVSPPNERTPLTTNGYKSPKRSGIAFYAVAILFFLPAVLQNLGLLRCPFTDVPADEKRALRRQWRQEQSEHQDEVARWIRERGEHNAELDLWDRERVAHRIEREDWLKQQQTAREEERKRQQEARDAFRREREEEEQQRRRAHEEDERQRRTAREAFQREREGWSRQRQEAERQQRQAREAFEQENQGWVKQREQEERHRLEVVRRSQGVYWTEPHGDTHCHSYGTRTYISYLKDIPGDLNWLEVCNDMPPVVIHGRELKKTFKCERNDNNEVVGVWYIDFDEPNCTPYWEGLTDKGCTPGLTGFKRFEARLAGIGSGDDWDMMCATTPATIGGVHFARPTTCENQGRWYGMVGMWDIPAYGCP